MSVSRKHDYYDGGWLDNKKDLFPIHYWACDISLIHHWMVLVVGLLVRKKSLSDRLRIKWMLGLFLPLSHFDYKLSQNQIENGWDGINMPTKQTKSILSCQVMKKKF